MSPPKEPKPKKITIPQPPAITIATENVQAKGFAKAGVVGEKAPTFYPDNGTLKKAGGRS